MCCLFGNISRRAQCSTSSPPPKAFLPWHAIPQGGSQCTIWLSFPHSFFEFLYIFDILLQTLQRHALQNRNSQIFLMMYIYGISWNLRIKISQQESFWNKLNKKVMCIFLFQAVGSEINPYCYSYFINYRLK